MITTPTEPGHQNASDSSARTGLQTVMLLTAAQSSAAAAANKSLARIGIDIHDLQLLAAVDNPGVDRRTLSERMHASQSDTIRLVRPIEKLGWLQRTDDGLFQRTTSGQALLDDAVGLAEDTVDHWLLERLSHEQIAQLSALLGSLATLS